jgi:hypothetical protein
MLTYSLMHFLFSWSGAIAESFYNFPGVSFAMTIQHWWNDFLLGLKLPVFSGGLKNS